MPSESRAILLSGVSIGIGAIGYGISIALLNLITLVTNLSFFHRWSFAHVSPAQSVLGIGTVLAPTLGGLIVGIMIRFWPDAVRGDGIPEAMEKALVHGSIIAPKVIVLKPIASAITIGSGGPFGAEGPIIATGAAVGSVIGQVLHISSRERRILLSAGAAAGIAAMFGAPISGVLIAVELLLFEYSLEAVGPVAIAAATAMGLRTLFTTTQPLFQMHGTFQLHAGDLGFALIGGIAFGIIGVAASKLVYRMEHLFAKLPVHIMWWPAIGGIAVGLIGLLVPRTLGIGYSNIDAALAGKMGFTFLVGLAVFKLLSWSIALGSGTAGGTLAPLFTIGGCSGGALGLIASKLLPGLNIDLRIAALAGMASVFASSSGTYFASGVFVIEATHCFPGIVPVLLSCAVASMVASHLTKTTIMTEKIFNRGIYFDARYSPDPLMSIKVGTIKTAVPPVITIFEDEVRVPDLREFEGPNAYIAAVERSGKWMGSISVRNLETLIEEGQLRSQLRDCLEQVAVNDSDSLRTALTEFARFSCDRLPVLSDAVPRTVVGSTSLMDIAKADYETRVDAKKRKQMLKFN